MNVASIYRRNGRWFAQVRKVGYSSQSKTFGSKAEANAWAASIENQYALWDHSRPCNAPRDLKLRDLIERYVQDVTIHKNGRFHEELRLKKIGRHPLCALPIKKLSPAEIAAYRDERLREVAPATVLKELNLMQSVVKRAINEWGLHIFANPFERIARPKVRNARDRRLSHTEMSILRASLASCRNPLAGFMIGFAIETGMRRGEILGLKWSDIDLEKGIARLIQTKNGHPRLVPLSTGAKAILQRTCTDRGDAGKVFPITVDALKSSWKRIIARSGIEGLRFHDLRHEAISRFFELGLSVPEVAHISGHRDPRMLFRYTHLRAADLAVRLRGVVAFAPADAVASVPD